MARSKVEATSQNRIDCNPARELSGLPTSNAPLVRGVEGMRGGRNAELRLAGVEDGEETLEEGHAVNEVQALTRRSPQVADDEEDAVGGPTDS